MLKTEMNCSFKTDSNLTWTATEKCYKTPLLAFEHICNKYNRLPVESTVFYMHDMKPYRGE